MSTARSKGTLAERLVVEYLQWGYWPNAERRALHGAKDLGDITGTPGLVWEVKNANRIDLPGWMRETDEERLNADADYGILVIKPKGYGEAQINNWPAVLPLYSMTELLNTAGYGGNK